MSIPSELGHLAMPTNFLALGRNKMVQASFEPRTCCSRGWYINTLGIFSLICASGFSIFCQRNVTTPHYEKSRRASCKPVRSLAVSIVIIPTRPRPFHGHPPTNHPSNRGGHHPSIRQTSASYTSRRQVAATPGIVRFTYESVRYTLSRKLAL